jgi:alpha-galactosidase
MNLSELGNEALIDFSKINFVSKEQGHYFGVSLITSSALRFDHKTSPQPLVDSSLHRFSGQVTTFYDGSTQIEANSRETSVDVEEKALNQLAGM